MDNILDMTVRMSNVFEDQFVSNFSARVFPRAASVVPKAKAGFIGPHRWWDVWREQAAARRQGPSIEALRRSVADSTSAFRRSVERGYWTCDPTDEANADPAGDLAKRARH